MSSASGGRLVWWVALAPTPKQKKKRVCGSTDWQCVACSCRGRQSLQSLRAWCTVHSDDPFLFIVALLNTLANTAMKLDLAPFRPSSSGMDEFSGITTKMLPRRGKRSRAARPVVEQKRAQLFAASCRAAHYIRRREVVVEAVGMENAVRRSSVRRPYRSWTQDLAGGRDLRRWQAGGVRRGCLN